MKQKLLTLFALLLGVCSGAWAADYTVTATRALSNSNKTSTWSAITANGGSAFENSKTALGSGLYFVAKGKCTLNGGNSLNVKANGEMYLEVPSATAAGTVKFTSGANDRYMQTESGSKVHMKGDSDNSDMKASLPFTSEDIVDVDGVKYLKLTSKSDCKFATVEIVLTSGAYLTMLTAPTITVEQSTGSVTIGNVENAEKVTYTTDGTTPTASSATYSKPFVVADGTVVKAIAIGNGTSYSNSDVATETVYLTDFKVAAPVVSQFNGTAVLNCATPNATIEYSTDGGTSWNTYSRAFTLTTTTDIKVRASRENCTTSDVTEETITAVPANTKTKTIVMGFGAFEGSGKVLTGLSSDVAKGFTLTMITDQDKSWSSRNSITISEIEGTRTTFCGSNGVQCKLDMPDGIIATQLRLYSYVNASTSTTNCAWKEVNGENLNSTLNTVPMGAFSDVENYQANPDVRIFPLDNVEGSLTFTNGGIQTCFVIVLDVIETEAISTLSGRNYASYVTTNKLDFASAEGITAYIATGLNGGGTAVELTPVDVVPASTPIIVKTETQGATVNVPVTTADASVSGNKLVAGDGTTAWNGTDGYTYFYLASDQFHKATSGTLQSGKAYLKIANGDVPAARSFGFVFGDATSIKAIDNAQLTIDNYYNLSGQRVAQPKKGLYIQNGKKVIIK